MAAGATTSACAVSVSVPVGGSIAEVHVEGISSVPLLFVNVTASAEGGPSLSNLISHASAVAASFSTPPLCSTVVTVTTSLVSTPLSSIATPMSLFDSPVGVFTASEKEMLTASTAYEATNARYTAVSDVGSRVYLPPPVVHHWVERAYPSAESPYVEGLKNENLMNAMMVNAISQPQRLSEIRRQWMHDNNVLNQARVAIQELMDEKCRLESQVQATGLKESMFVSEKNRVEDDLKRVTTNLAEERILWARDVAEKDRVITHPKAIQEELERKAVVEAQKARSELFAKMEKFCVDTDFVSQVQERYQGLTVELEASNAKVQAKHAELEEQEEQLRKLKQVCDSLVSEKNQLVQSSCTHQARLKEAENALDQSIVEVDSLTSRLAGLQGDKSFVTLLDCLSTVAYQSGHHDCIYHGCFDCQRSDKITPEFHGNRGKLQGDMVDALEAACNDPPPAYAELTEKVAKDGVDSLHQMMDVAEESDEE
ncbi:hypothetical protein Hanom_Chr12g01144171 [Helianthus anomalus]